MDESEPTGTPEPPRPLRTSSDEAGGIARQPRVYSLKTFFLELATITAGVLIALSVDSLREWQQHRGLVRQARETIAREIAANKGEVQNALDTADDRNKALRVALVMASDLLAGRPAQSYELRIGMSLSELNEAAWVSAERTGALTHMEYDEVQKYARLYALQELYELQQRRALERLTAAIAMLSHDDPTKAPAADVEAFRRELLGLLGELGVLDEFGKELTEAYDTF